MKTRILLVDDEADYSSMMRARLEAAGYFEIREENDEVHALSAAREFEPDLVLLDVMMPRLEGSEVAAMFRKDSRFRNTPILFLTALVSEEDAPSGSYSSGGNTFIPKSLPMAGLIECINAAVGRKKEAEAVVA